MNPNGHRWRLNWPEHYTAGIKSQLYFIQISAQIKNENPVTFVLTLLSSVRIAQAVTWCYCTRASNRNSFVLMICLSHNSGSAWAIKTSINLLCCTFYNGMCCGLYLCWNTQKDALISDSKAFSLSVMITFSSSCLGFTGNKWMVVPTSWWVRSRRNVQL